MSPTGRNTSGSLVAKPVLSEPSARRRWGKGDFVKKGTVLARLPAIDYEHELATAQAQVSEARASARLARTDLERAEKLFGMHPTETSQRSSKRTRRARTRQARRCPSQRS